MSFIKWFTITKRKQRIIDKILKRSDLCLYDQETGNKFNTSLECQTTNLIFLFSLTVDGAIIDLDLKNLRSPLLKQWKFHFTMIWRLGQVNASL